MGWEFAAVWADEPDKHWYWLWRRVADDSGQLLAESPRFTALEQCIDHARSHGYDEDGCPAV